MANKYNISYIETKETRVINFRSKKNMIDYLNKNKTKLYPLKTSL